MITFARNLHSEERKIHLLNHEVFDTMYVTFSAAGFVIKSARGTHPEKIVVLVFRPL